MNKKILKPFLCAALLVAAHGSACAAADADFPASYADAIRLALAQRGELAIEQVNVDKMNARIEEAKGASLPSLDAYSTAQRARSYQDFSGVEVSAVYNNVTVPVSVKSVTPAYQLNAGLELSYNLYSGGLNRARVDERLAARQAAQAQRESTRKKIVLDVTTAYWDVRKAQILHRTTAQSLDHAKQALALAQDQFKRGRIARIELDAKALMLETRDIELRNQSRKLADGRRRYAYALGLDAVRARDGNAPAPDERAAGIEVDRLLAGFGLLRAPETTAAQADLDGAKARVAQAQSEYKPTVDLFARYNGIGRGNDSLGSAASGYGRDNMSVGVRLKWNLFDGYRSSARVTQAALESEQMQLRMEQARRGLAHDWQEKLSRETELQDQLALALKQADLAQSELKIAGKRWETRTISMVEFHAAQLRAEEANGKVKVAEIDLLVARVAAQLAAVDG